MKNFTCCAADAQFHEPTAKEKEKLRQNEIEREKKMRGEKNQPASC